MYSALLSPPTRPMMFTIISRSSREMKYVKAAYLTRLFTNETSVKFKSIITHKFKQCMLINGCYQVTIYDGGTDGFAAKKNKDISGLFGMVSEHCNTHWYPYFMNLLELFHLVHLLCLGCTHIR